MKTLPMTHASLCTGIGACELAATWMKWENLFSCEVDEFCNRVLKHHYPKAKHYGNIFEQDFREWRGRVDVLTAGFPCQPFSCAGKRNGAEDDRYLWPEVLRVIKEVRPTWFIGENVAGIISMVLPSEEITVGSYEDICGESYEMHEKRQRYVIEQIRFDLASIGYSVQPVVIPACAVGAPHRRDRVWFIASNDSDTRHEGVRPKREDEIRGFEFTSDSRSARFQTRGGEQQTTGITGSGLQWVAPNTHGDRFGIRKNKQGNITGSQGASNNCTCSKDGIIAYTTSERLQGEVPRDAIMPSESFRDFPTQSPVCGRDDGISTGLSGITFSKWRQQSIKALGNSMVPQVVCEIFKAIKKVEFGMIETGEN